MPLLFVENFNLLCYGFFVDMLEDVTYTLVADANESGLCSSFFEDFGVTGCLNHGESILLFVGTYFAGDTHALCQQFEKLVIDIVNLLSQRFKAFGSDGVLTNGKLVENEVKDIGSDLLLGIAPRLIGLAMTLDDEAFETKVHGLL